MKQVRLILVGLIAALLATLGLTTTSLGPASATPAPAAATVAKAKTTVTVKIANCDGCKMWVSSVMASDYDDIWEGKGKKVKNGEVSWKVPTDRTAGLSIALDAPWEGAVPYQTIVALRYKGFKPGDKVSYSDINTAKKASGCWAGTAEAAATIKVKVKKVTVQGNTGPVKGTIAFAKVTQDYLQPMQRVWNGVLGSQDVFACGPTS